MSASGLFVLFFTFLMLVADNAYAYLDPGTGSMIIQSIIGTIVLMGAGIGVFWSKIKSLFIRSDKKEEQN